MNKEARYLDIFSGRRSVRHFTENEVSEEFLDSLLAAAMHAPTTGNMQLCSVVVTRDAACRERLAPAHFNQPATKAPVLLTFCADHRRFEKWCECRQAEPGYGNLQSFVAAALDATIFAQQFCTLAELNGLGTCYLGTTTYNAPQIAETLGLPSRVVPIITVAVGWPAETPEDCGRLPLEAIRHRERYADPTEADIDRFYAEKEARHDSQRFVEENGKQTLAQVFTDVRYTRADAETFSSIFATFLKQQGY